MSKKSKPAGKHPRRDDANSATPIQDSAEPMVTDSATEESAVSAPDEIEGGAEGANGSGVTTASDGEAGSDGSDGEAGSDGFDGEAGSDGADGSDGAVGTDEDIEGASVSADAEEDFGLALAFEQLSADPPETDLSPLSVLAAVQRERRRRTKIKAVAVLAAAVTGIGVMFSAFGGGVTDDVTATPTRVAEVPTATGDSGGEDAETGENFGRNPFTPWANRSSESDHSAPSGETPAEDTATTAEEMAAPESVASPTPVDFSATSAGSGDLRLQQAFPEASDQAAIGACATAVAEAVTAPLGHVIGCSATDQGFRDFATYSTDGKFSGPVIERQSTDGVDVRTDRRLSGSLLTAGDGTSALAIAVVDAQPTGLPLAESVDGREVLRNRYLAALEPRSATATSSADEVVRSEAASPQGGVLWRATSSPGENADWLQVFAGWPNSLVTAASGIPGTPVAATQLADGRWLVVNSQTIPEYALLGEQADVVLTPTADDGPADQSGQASYLYVTDPREVDALLLLLAETADTLDNN